MGFKHGVRRRLGFKNEASDDADSGSVGPQPPHFGGGGDRGTGERRVPENLGGAPQAELELRVLLLLIPASFTALGQLPGMGGKLGRDLGQS